MGSFAKFIESEAFFPVLILLFLMLMFVFVSILMSGKKKDRQQLQDRKNIKIDENAQVQLVQNSNFKKQKIEKVQEEIVEENNVDEVKIVLEEKSNDVQPFIKDDIIKEDVIKNEGMPIENLVESNNVDKEQNTLENLDVGDEFVIPHQKNEDDIVELSINSSLNAGSQTEDAESENTINENVNNTVTEAFNQIPNGDVTINTNIVSEEPKEYVGEKTEILDFPDFDLMLEKEPKNEEIEDEIIDAANKYIESIMNSSK